jgi:phosphoglycerol transferase MdoB-like AlkP superfamily enzyme
MIRDALENRKSKFIITLIFIIYILIIISNVCGQPANGTDSNTTDIIHDILNFIDKLGSLSPNPIYLFPLYVSGILIIIGVYFDPQKNRYARVILISGLSRLLLISGYYWRLKSLLN